MTAGAAPPRLLTAAEDDELAPSTGKAGLRLALAGWTLEPHTVAWVGLPLYAYLRFHRLLRPTPAQVAAFVAGVAVLFVALISPLHRAADASSFSLHVAQHMLLQMVAPPLLVLGIPKHAWERLAAGRRLQSAFRLWLHPIVAIAVYDGVLFFWHWPLPMPGGELRLACGVLSDLATQSPAMRVVQDLLPPFAGLLFWASVLLAPPLSPAPQATRLAMVLGSMVFNWLISFSIAARDVPMYATYAGTRPPFGLSPMADQMVGAGILWEHGNMTYALALVAMLRGWLRERTERTERTEQDAISRPADLAGW